MDHARLAHFETAVVAARGVARRAEEAANHCAEIRRECQLAIERATAIRRPVTDEMREALAKAEVALAQAAAERNAAHTAVTSAGSTLTNCQDYAKRIAR